jgi:hypothetical protein
MFDVLRNDYLKIFLIHFFDKHTDLKKNLNFDIFRQELSTISTILKSHVQHSHKKSWVLTQNIQIFFLPLYKNKLVGVLL